MSEVPNWTKYQDGEIVFVPPTRKNPLGFSDRQLRCVGLKCPYCGNRFEYHKGRMMPTRDHFYPRSRFKHFYAGNDEVSLTTVMCCNGCNQAKRDLGFEEWCERNCHHKSHRNRALSALREGLHEGYYRIATRKQMHRALHTYDDPRGIIGLPFEYVINKNNGPRA